MWSNPRRMRLFCGVDSLRTRNFMDITIAGRFCGPSRSGNGGYSSGRLAAYIDGPAEITLRAPPPLDTALRVEREGDGVRLWHGEQLVAEGRPTELELELPVPPSWDEARESATRYRGIQHHDYPDCFVCGPNRKPGDGLCIQCGLWRDSVVAGIWVPDASLDDGRGRVRPEFLWAAIDCPGSWSFIGQPQAGSALPPPGSSILLGRLAGRVLRELRIGQECVVTGWPLGHEGRKYHVGSAVYLRDGTPIAYSRGTWIALK